MVRFFFDVDGAGRRTRDEVGLDLPSRREAAREAAFLLRNIVQGEMLKGESRIFAALVRDDRDVTIYRETAVLDIECLGPSDIDGKED